MPCPDHLEIPSLTLLVIILNVLWLPTHQQHVSHYGDLQTWVWCIHAADTTSG